MSLNKKTKKVQKTGIYRTLPLAEAHTRDKDTNAAIPSKENVSDTRDWSIENKL